MLVDVVRRPVQAAMLALAASSISGSTITSEIAVPSPGLRNRAASAMVLGLSPERLITQFEITTSALESPSGMSSM